jgi:DNA-binding response OmpR family regulator
MLWWRRDKESVSQMPAPDQLVVLVIEDDPLVSILLQDILQEEGYQVLLAENGEQALVILTTARPDLVTLDLNLPGMGGDVVLKELRKQDTTKELPVIVVTALETIPRQVQKLAQAVIQKPFEIDRLLSTIHRFLPLS